MARPASVGVAKASGLTQPTRTIELRMKRPNPMMMTRWPMWTGRTDVDTRSKVGASHPNCDSRRY
jgi:hypothetical protein